jgi:hypothetical protein
MTSADVLSCTTMAKARSTPPRSGTQGGTDQYAAMALAS